MGDKQGIKAMLFNHINEEVITDIAALGFKVIITKVFSYTFNEDSDAMSLAIIS